VVVYKLTIADTVEERILDLQEAKRKLANAAIEGGKAIGKLSMKDILALFRRDAEHLPEHAGGVESLDSRFRVLDGSPRKVERKGVLEKKGTRERQEHPVYGRR